MASGDTTATMGTLSDSYGAVFDGIDDKITCGSISKEMNNGFTVSCWIYRKAETLGAIFRDTSGDKFWFNVQNGSDELRFYASDLTPTSNQIASGISLNEWNHVALTFDGTNSIIYVNGVLKQSVAHTGTFSLAATFSICHLSNSFPGCISDALMFNKVLPQTEITNISAGRKVTNGLIHHWKLSEDYKDRIGSADGTSTGAYLIKDYANEVVADVSQINLAATTDKFIAIPISGRNQKVAVIGVNREA